jgi:hypothetical protein
MTRALVLWLLLLAVASLGAVVTLARCPGCIPRDRVNDRCAWTEVTGVPLDLGNSADWAHLVEDAQLAEELAIRYADAEHGRRFGVAHHGGLLENGRVRQECLSRLFETIEISHDVSSGQILRARGERSATFDLAVVVLFLPLYTWGATIACRRLGRRFGSGERAARFVATALTSVAAALLGQQAFRLWGALWEAFRVGNGHMTSIRGASESAWTRHYVGADFAGALLLFWIIVVICERRVAADADSTDARGTLGLLQPTFVSSNRSASSNRRA